MGSEMCIRDRSEVMTLMAAHHMRIKHHTALGEVTYVCEDSAHLPQYFAILSVHIS